MKRAIRTVFLIALTLAFSGNAMAFRLLTDPDNPHNLSASSNNAVEAQSETQICVFCHTPHGGDAQGALWSRKHITDVKTFPMYNSVTLVIKNVAAAQYDDNDPAKYPNGTTRMCLSCHDGSTALGYGIGDLRTGDSIDMTVSSLNGRASQIDLSVTHPVSFVYDVGNDGVDDVVINTINATKPGTNQYQLPPVPDFAPLDGQGRVQCTTCHDPHKDTRPTGPDFLPFWRNEIDGYVFTCGECHLGDDGDDILNPPPDMHLMPNAL